MTSRSVESAPTPPFQGTWPLVGALLLLGGSLAFFWPGIVSYDAVGQYAQATGGRYDDWHPPVMARLWSLLEPDRWGAGPMLALQLAGYWIGLGLIARAAGGRRAIVILLVGLFPPLLGWQGVIVKDSQLTAAMLLATGLIVWRRPMPLSLRMIVAVLIAYALLVRANALFGVVPFVVLIGSRSRPGWAHAAGFALGIATVLIATPFVNHRLLAARDSGVQRTIPLYDLTGIAVRTGDPVTGLPPGAVRTLAERGCVKPLFWDPLGEREDCAAAVARLGRQKPSQLYAALAVAAIRHPIAYLEQRLAHWNSTERWMVGGRWPLAAPPSRTEPNDQGLPGPASRFAARWMTIAGDLAATPLCWPILWTMAAAIGLWASWSGESKEEAVARALFASAAGQELSFLAISISSDLRYHLWPMVATAVGWVFLARWAASRHLWVLAVGSVTLIPSGFVARCMLPSAPTDYAALLK